MPQYAKNTNVSSELSRIEIEKILVRRSDATVVKDVDIKDGTGDREGE